MDGGKIYLIHKDRQIMCYIRRNNLKEKSRENKDLVSKHWKRNCVVIKISSPHLKERTTSYLWVVRRRQDNPKL